MADLYVVRKPFTADGEVLHVGEVVEGRGWRTLRKLVSLRYLHVFHGQDVECPICGRYWESEEVLREHIAIHHAKPEQVSEEGYPPNDDDDEKPATPGNNVENKSDSQEGAAKASQQEVSKDKVVVEKPKAPKLPKDK
jgi:hypothetical protein